MKLNRLGVMARLQFATDTLNDPGFQQLLEDLQIDALDAFMRSATPAERESAHQDLEALRRLEGKLKKWIDDGRRTAAADAEQQDELKE